ncbi:MAG: LysM peptidoglycan-binding domain-containing protein [Bdellovibrionales bacterium]|nr:LysM peptidoglycan-binding domain-containing protein [Bdellovibrionales bacterium]
MTRTLYILLLVGLGLGVSAEARYKLNPYSAERTIASLGVGEPLKDEEWLDILGNRQSETYVVQPADTLWDISSALFQNPYLWPKLWQVNSFITNPHIIEPGQVLNFYREQILREVASANEMQIIRLRPPGSGDESALFVNVAIKNNFRPSLLVLTEQDEVYGEISGAYSERTWFVEGDTIYLDMDDPQSVRIGDRFGVVHENRDIRDGTQPGAPMLGTVVRVVGEVEIEGFGEYVVKARVVTSLAPMSREDILISTVKTVEWSQVEQPPDDMEARVVMGEQDEIQQFGQGEFVLLNKGEQDGFKTGYMFRVYRDTDPHTGDSDDVAVDFKGEIQVVYVGSVSSVGFVVRNEEPIFKGDILLPYQAFLDPPPPPRRRLDVLELDAESSAPLSTLTDGVPDETVPQ